MFYFNGNKTECLKKLFNAHFIIYDVRQRINKLYDSATSLGSQSFDGMPKSPNPKKFEGIMVEIIYLKEYATLLLKKRAEFDLFICSLNPFYYSLLNLRCEECRTWKEIAGTLDISTVSAKRNFKKICVLAEDKGLFESGGFDILEENSEEDTN